MGAVEKSTLCTYFLSRVTVRDTTTRMGPGVLGCLVIVVLCYVTRCSCKIAHQTGANEVQQERRKIVKLLLRNFPLQESSSYQNLVEEDDGEHNIEEDEDKEHNLLEYDEEEHPQFQYEPLYPYEEPSIEDEMYYRPILKSLDKSEFSRFEHALSSFLLPPPIDSGRVNVDTTVEANEDNADIYYQGYNYPDSYPNIGKMVEEAEEDNADLYYEAYVHPNANVQDNAEKYYEGYIHPANNLEKYIKSFEDPTEDDTNEYYVAYVQPNTEDNADEYYEPYTHTSSNLPYSQYTQTQQELEKLPELGDGYTYEGPMEALEDIDNKEHRYGEYENEIVDVPQIIVKFEN